MRLSPPGTATATQQTDKCAVTGIYKLCAPVTITVPFGTFYKVDVHTSMTAFGSVAGQGLFCAASEGPACLNSSPSGFTLAPGQYMNVSHSGTAYFGSERTRRHGRAVDVGIAQNVNTAYTTTTIRWHRYTPNPQRGWGVGRQRAAAQGAEKPPEHGI